MRGLRASAPLISDVITHKNHKQLYFHTIGLISLVDQELETHYPGYPGNNSNTHTNMKHSNTA